MSTDDSTPIEIRFELSDAVNYASWQNSVPILRKLEIANQSAHSYSDLRVILDSSPALIRPKEWLISRLAPAESIVIRDRDVQVDSTYLNGLNEAEKGSFRFRLLQDQALLSEVTHEVRVLARDEWGGMSIMAELLAAFVMPNDPALAPVLKLTGDVLAKHGYSSALDGYQSRDPKRAYLLTAAIWSALASAKLNLRQPTS